MAVKLNSAALAHAQQLLDDDQYMINTVWSSNEPSPEQEQQYLDRNGLDAYAQWFLGIDTDEPADSKARYKYPYGNFKKLHRSGVIAAKQRAAQHKAREVVDGADQILDLLDRMNAC